MLETILGATDPDLTTTGALKLRLGLDASSTGYDAVLSATIRAASRWAETYVGYPLTLGTYRETLPGYGRRTLRLARTPIRAVTALYAATSTDEGPQIFTSEFRVEDRAAGLLSRDIGFAWTAPVELELDLRPLPGEEYRPYMADYVAGYSYAGVSTDSPHWSTEWGTTSTGRTLPEDVEEAVLAKAQAIHEEQAGTAAAGGGDVASEQLDDIRVNYRSASSDSSSSSSSSGGGRFLGLSEVLLEPYRRLV